MDIKELRIGNKVYYNSNNKSIGVVTSIRGGFVQENGVLLDNRIKPVIPISKIRPIEINENILNFHGFKKISPVHYILTLDSRITIEINISESCDYSWINDHPIKKIRYVHELQNILYTFGIK